MNVEVLSAAARRKADLPLAIRQHRWSRYLGTQKSGKRRKLTLKRLSTQIISNVYQKKACSDEIDGRELSARRYGTSCV